jgi:iron complex outermembrane receptor protein
LLLTSALAATAGAFAQSTAPTTKVPEPEAEQTINLPAFTITEKAANPYQSQQALSSSRVAMAIQDVPQTISVVSSELIKDSMGARMLDVAKYVTPVVESSLPYGGDRYQIRGFQVSQEFIDGTVISGADGYSMSMAPFNIERVEVLKGPNAILVPGGSPGGVMNPITKSPLFRDQASVTIDLAQYYGTGVNTDVNRVLNEKGTMAARVVAAYWRNEGYIKNNYRHGYMIAPSFTIKLTPTETLTIKGEVLQNRELNLGGVPLDPSIGSNDTAEIARGLPRDWSFGNDVDTRHRKTERLSAELLSIFGDHVTSRLYVMGDHVIRGDTGGTSAALANAGGGSRNPYTGLWEPGVNWNTSAYNADTTGTVVLTGTAVPVTDPSTWTYTRNNGRVYLEYHEIHLKNDYAIRFENQWFKSTTITGLSANFSKVRFQSRIPAGRPAVANNNLDAITYPGYSFLPTTPGFTNANKGTDKTGKQEDLQLFAYETVGFWQDRVQLSGGVSRFFGQLDRTDNSGTAIDPNYGVATATSFVSTVPSYNLSDTATSFGVVVKPIKSVSVFYGRNTTGGTMPGSLGAGANPSTLKLAEGSQNEYGVKTTQLNGAFTASFSYFDIVQSNYAVPNSEYYNLVAQGKFAEAAALQNPLYLDLTSKGWEIEATYSIGKNLSLLGNYTKYKMRQPITEVRLRAVPDQAGGFYADYRFTEGALNRFSVNVGVDYKGEAAGDGVSGYTTSRLLPNGTLVPVQPSFMVAARTLVNLGVAYRADSWTARLQVNNLLDKDYILAAGSRTSVVVGDPMNVKASFTYNF